MKFIDGVPKKEHSKVTVDAATQFTYVHAVLPILTFERIEILVFKVVDVANFYEVCDLEEYKEHLKDEK